MKEPAWLVHLVDQRLALIEQALGSSVPETNFIMTPLVEPDEHVTPQVYARWDRTCDSCHTYCPDDQPFYTGHVTRQLRIGTTVFMTFGVCQGCKPSLEE